MVNDFDLAKRVFACIDNTTLNATDTVAGVEAFCRRTKELSIDGEHVAAVCVYPRFVDVAKNALKGSNIHVASVAGAFPHGQLPIELKVEEVKYAVVQGADEVDVVISRGLILDGDFDTARAEVEAMKKACMGRTLKVILETGELLSPTLVACAAGVAIDGGADFVKTSTGKSGVGATLEAAEAMLKVVAEYKGKTGRTIGFKAAGGIRKPEEAVAYAQLAKKIMGEEYVGNTTFRIGASSLTDNLYSLLNIS